MNKKLMVAALAVTLVGGSYAGAALLPTAKANPQAGPSVQASTAVQAQAQTDNDKEVADDLNGQPDSDKEVADDQNGQNDNDKEVADDLENSVKITKEQSIAIATKEIPGNVTSSNVEDENGKAVYSVTINDKNGKEQEVTVDAVTGTIIPESGK
jgi:uncharacterized membrane protein YkoI